MFSTSSELPPSSSGLYQTTGPLPKQLSSAESAIDARIQSLTLELCTLAGGKDSAEALKKFKLCCADLHKLVEKIEGTKDYPALKGTFPLKTAKTICQEAETAGFDKWVKMTDHFVPPEGPLPKGALKNLEDKLLFHIFGDPYGQGTGYEGEDQRTVLAFAKTFLEAVGKENPAALLPIQDHADPTQNEKLAKKLKAIDPLIDGCLDIFQIINRNRDAQDVTPDVAPLTDLIRTKLEKQGNVLIPGGWAGVPAGHAMYYEAMRQANGKYTFRVYNRGAGVGYHPAPIEAPHKLLYRACLEISDVEQERILSPRFIQSLIELQTHPREVNGSDLDIYEGQLSVLEGNWQKINLELEDAVSLQHSGTCTWKSFCAFLRGKLTYSEYKLFKFRVKQQALWDYYTQNIEGLRTDYAKRLLFEKSMESFARTMEKVGEGGLISSMEYLQTAVSLARLKKEFLALGEQRIAALKQNAPHIDCQAKPIPWTAGKLYYWGIDALKRSSFLGQELPSDALTRSVEAWSPSAKTFVEDLHRFQQQFAEATAKGRHTDVQSAFLQLMDKLPLPELSPKNPFWKELQRLAPKKMEQLMQSLSDIHHQLFLSTQLLVEPDNREPNLLVAVYKSLAIQDQFIQLVGPENLGLKGMKAPPDFSALCYFNGEEFRTGKQNRQMAFPLRDAKAKEELTALYHYFMARAAPFKSGRLAFEPSVTSSFYVKITEGSEAGSRRSPALNPEHAFMKGLLQDKAFIKKIEQQIPGFSRLSPLEQMAELDTKEELNILPKTFLLYRRQAVETMFWMNSPLAPASTLTDPVKELTLTRSHKGLEEEWGEKGKFVTLSVNQERSVVCRPITAFEQSCAYFSSAAFQKIYSFLQHYVSLPQNLLLERPENRSRQMNQMALLASTSAAQITETLAYMVSYPEKLRERDFQLYFEMLLFDKDLMLQELRQHPEFIMKISDFVNKTYASYREQGCVDACTFLVRLSGYLSDHWNYVSKQDPSLSAFSPKFLDKLHEMESLLKMGSLTDTEKSLIYAGVFSACSKLSDISVDKLKLILMGLVHLDRHPLPKEWHDPALARDKRSTMQNATKLWRRLPFQQMSALLNEIAMPYRTKDKKPYEWVEGQFPIYRNKENSCIVDLLSGRLFIEGSESTGLPVEIKGHHSYQEIFDKEYPAKGLDLYTYEFLDGMRQKNRVHYKQGSLGIEKEIQGLSFAYFSGKPKFCNALCRELNTFLHTGPPMKGFLCDRTGRPCYRLHFQNDLLTGVESLLDKSPLFLVDIYGTQTVSSMASTAQKPESKKTPYDCLKNFEKLDEIMVWEDQKQQPQKIELPRFKLTFIPAVDPKHKSKGLRWECQQIKGYYLSEEQFVEMLAKLNMDHFLKLENSKGEVKILLPRQEMSRGRAMTGDRVFWDAEEQQRYLIYDYHKIPGRAERELKCGPEEGLYMALLGLSSGSSEGYRLARHLLDPNKMRTGKVREGELQVLNWICRLKVRNKDEDSRAMALRLHALYLLSTQLERGQAQGVIESKLTDEKEFWKGVQADLNGYVNTLQHCLEFHLPQHEMLHVCKLQMQQEALLPSVVHYLQQAGPGKAPEWVAGLQKVTGRPYSQSLRLKYLEQFVQSSDYSISQKLQSRQEALRKDKDYIGENTYSEPNLLMRPLDPYLFFVKNLPIAHGGSPPQKQALREKLKLMIGSNDEDTLALAAVLQVVLDYPNKFNVPTGVLIDWEKAMDSCLVPAVQFAIKLEKSKQPEITTPLKPLPGKEKVPLRPEKMPAPIAAPSKVPGLLYGDVETFSQAKQSVAGVDLKKYVLPADPVKTGEVKKQRAAKLQLVHQDVKKLLEIPADRVGKKVLERLQEGCDTYLKKQLAKGEESQICPDKVDELVDTLELEIQFRVGLQHQAAARLCLLAEQAAELKHGALQRILQVLGGRAEKMSIDDVCLYYARGDLHHPELAKEVEKYLIEATYTQKLERVRQAALDWIEAEGEEKVSAESALIAEVEKERLIDPAAQPAFLLLEYKANILMNKVQKEGMQEFLKTGRISNAIRHMIMGSGKTSVLMTLLSLLRADGKRLCTLVLTDELLESMSEEVRSGIVHTFDQLIVPFEVNPHADWSVDKLKEMKEALERCRTGKGSLITSPKSMHSFYLMLLDTSFQSHAAQGEEKKILLEKLGLQREIMQLFATYGAALLDEVDVLLNCRTEVNFPAGRELMMPAEEQDLLLDLYDLLLENREIQNVLRCDFHPSSAGPEAALYMEGPYLSTVKPKIVDLFLEQLKNPKSSAAPYVLAFAGILPEQYALLRDYLLQADNPQAEKFVAVLPNKAVKNVLALLKEELTTLLPMSLEKNCGEHYNYSLLSALAYAIPCVSGKRIEGSQFANAHETANYTIQTALKYGIQKNVILNKLSALQGRCLEELQAGKPLKECAAYKEFIALTGVEEERYHLAKLSAKDKAEIIDQINGDRSKQRKFLKEYVIPAIRFHQRKLNSNAQMLARFFHEVDGFSGTLWNADTFPNMLHPLPEHDVDAMSLFLLGGRLTEVQPDGTVQKKNNVQPIAKTDGASVLEGARQAIQSGINVLAIADCGGYLNEEDPGKLAAAMTEMVYKINPKVQGTAYHNRDSELVMHETGGKGSERFSQSTLTKQQRLTLYFQPYTTGTDIKQSAQATQLLTIGRTTLLRDLFQTAWRMRELARGQRIQFLVADDVAKVIRKKLSLPADAALTQDHILKFCLINQMEQLSDDTVVAAKLKMLTMIQWEIIKVVLDPQVSNEQVSQLFVEEMLDLFCPEQPTEAHDMYGGANRATLIGEIMNHEMQECLGLLNRIREKVELLKQRIDPDALEKQLKELISKELLPEKALAPANETLDQFVQVQQKQKQKAKQRQVQQQETQLKGAGGSWASFPWPDVAPEKMFDPSYFKIPLVAELYKLTEQLPAISLPPVKQMIAPLAAVAYQAMPELTTLLAAMFGGLYLASKFNYQAAAFWQGLDRESHELYNVTRGEIQKQLLPLRVWGEGAPYPYPLSAYLRKESLLEPLAKAIDPRLRVTQNYAPKKAYSGEMKVPKPLEDTSKDVRELLLIQDKRNKSWQVLLIDKEELQFFRAKLAQDKKEKKAVERTLRLCLFHPITGVIQPGSEAVTDNEIQRDPELLHLIVQAKFLNGESLYTEAEQEALKKWLVQNDPKALKQVLFQHILPKRDDYDQACSRMDKIFAAVIG